MKNKPMYCPMSLANSEAAVGYFNAPTNFKPMECTPDCAWAGKRQGRYFCTVPAKISEWTEEINSRPLDGDAE